MFTPSRFVVVDDNEKHLTAIVKIFQLLGCPCMGIRYEAETPLDSRYFRGVRALFVDLHLLEGLAASDEARHFALITSILEDNIDAFGGPFVLVVWTRYPQLCNQLIAYLDGHIDAAKPQARPLSVISLDKEKFINLETGDVQKPEELRAGVEDAVSKNPQLTAMLSWETDVLSAAGATLTALIGLVPSASRRTGTYPAALDTQLSRLAVAAVGEKNVPNDKRAALNAALTPMLGDRIQNQTVSAAMKTVWDSAVTKDQDPNLNHGLTDIDAGQVNRMLHLALPDGETIRATDWGAVVNFPGAWRTDEEMRARYGSILDEVIGNDFKVKPQDSGRCRVRLVRVGAVCDHAQGHTGPVPYLVGLEIPVDVKRNKVSDAEWRSPIMLVAGNNEPFRLHVNSRQLATVTAPQTQGWAIQYRLREQLLMDLISHAAGYSGRPGVVYTGKP
jgi:hypothetical protein